MLNHSVNPQAAQSIKTVKDQYVPTAKVMDLGEWVACV